MKLIKSIWTALFGEMNKDAASPYQFKRPPETEAEIAKHNRHCRNKKVSFKPNTKRRWPCLK